MGVGGRDVAIAMSRLGSHKDEQLNSLVLLYDELGPMDRDEPGVLERLCLSVGMHPAEYFGKISAVAYRYNYDVSAFTAAAASPLIIQKSAEYAMERTGFKDRELILKTSKVLEQTPLVSVTQSNQTIQVASNLPSLGQITGRVSELAREDIIEGELIPAQEPLVLTQGDGQPDSEDQQSPRDSA